MASKAVENTVAAYLRANFTDCDIFLENIEGTPKNNRSDFIRLEFPVSNVSRPPLATKLYREEGGFRIMIVVKRGTGMTVIRDRGEKLCQLFRDETLDGEARVRCLAANPPRSDPDNAQEGQWVSFITVEYWASWRA